jgi:hypothetical protein
LGGWFVDVCLDGFAVVARWDEGYFVGLGIEVESGLNEETKE